MAAFIFLCDISTEQECLDRNLFGTNPGESQRFHYSNIRVGDTLFLYNLETGILRGPFTAETTCLLNIEKSAWKKTKRSFPWQVRVSAVNASKVPLNADELARLVPLAASAIGLLPPPSLDDDQQAVIESAIIAKNKS